MGTGSFLLSCQLREQQNVEGSEGAWVLERFEHGSQFLDHSASRCGCIFCKWWQQHLPGRLMVRLKWEDEYKHLSEGGQPRSVQPHGINLGWTLETLKNTRPHPYPTTSTSTQPEISNPLGPAPRWNLKPSGPKARLTLSPSPQKFWDDFRETNS